MFQIDDHVGGVPEVEHPLLLPELLPPASTRPPLLELLDPLLPELPLPEPLPPELLLDELLLDELLADPLPDELPPLPEPELPEPLLDPLLVAGAVPPSSPAFKSHGAFTAALLQPTPPNKASTPKAARAPAVPCRETRIIGSPVTNPDYVPDKAGLVTR
jgi:hypothetical protein